MPTLFETVTTAPSLLICRCTGTGDPTPEEDTTIWYVPLELKTADKSGKATIDHKAILDKRETVLPLEDAANAFYKLNAETAGVCESASTSTRRLSLSFAP